MTETETHASAMVWKFTEQAEILKLEKHCQEAGICRRRGAREPVESESFMRTFEECDKFTGRNERDHQKRGGGEPEQEKVRRKTRCDGQGNNGAAITAKGDLHIRQMHTFGYFSDVFRMERKHRNTQQHSTPSKRPDRSQQAQRYFSARWGGAVCTGDSLQTLGHKIDCKTLSNRFANNFWEWVTASLFRSTYIPLPSVLHYYITSYMLSLI